VTNRVADTSQRKAVRVAGFMFLFALIFILLHGAVLSKLIVAENVIATANSIMANELLFRISIIIELIISAVAVVLALALYIILKPVNKNLALLALYLKLAEAIITTVIAHLNFIVLQILNGQAYLTVFEPEQLQALVGLFLNVQNAVWSIPMVFLGLNLTIFSYLFFKSKYIPRILAVLGILSYAFIFIYAFVNILVPKYAAIPIIEITLFAPSFLFEIIIVFWLLFKGINVQQRDNRGLESA